MPAKGVKYLDRQWCVMSPSASATDPNIPGAVNYACTYADCTSLGAGSTCNGLDLRSNYSYAFNQFYQTADQQKAACEFSNLTMITQVDPSQGKCRFEIMIDLSSREVSPPPPRNRVHPNGSGEGFHGVKKMLWRWVLVVFMMLPLFWFWVSLLGLLICTCWCCLHVYNIFMSHMEKLYVFFNNWQFRLLWLLRLFIYLVNILCITLIYL